MSTKGDLRVLIVEDSQDDAQLLIRALTREGYNLFPRIVTDRREYLDALESGSWGIILCDYTLPHFSGLEALAILNERESQIPFIFVSATIGEDRAVEAMRSGANDYVIKGNLKRLLPAIERELVAAEVRRERKLALSQLRENEEKLRNIIDHSSNLFYSHSVDHTITYVSPQSKTFLDCDPEEALTRWTEFLTDHPINQLGLKSTERAITTGIQQPPYELELKGKKGRRIWVEVREAPVVEDGKTIAIVGSLSDITERKRAEDRLLESESLLSESQKLAHVGSWRLEVKADRLTWSEEVYHIFGMHPMEFQASLEAFLEAVHPDDRDMVHNAYSSSVREGRDGYEIEHRIIRKHTGEIRHVHEKCLHVKDDSGNIIRSVGMVQDITDRKVAEQAVLESEERYRALAENFPEGTVCIYDRDLRLQYVAGMELTQSGRPKEDFLGKHFSELAPPITYEIAGSVLRDAFEGKIGSYETPYFDNRHYYVGVAPIKVVDGIVQEIMVVSRNITAMKQAEEALRVSESEYRGLFEQANDAIVIFEPDNEMILEVNNRACQMYGFTRNELLGRSLKELTRDVARGEEQIRTLLAAGTYQNFETVHRRKDGSEIDVIASSSVIQYKGKKAIQSINRDITEWNRAQATLKQLTRAVEQSPVSIIITNKDGAIEYVNPKFTEVSGYAREEILGKNPRFLKSGHTSPEEYQTLWNTITSGDTWRGEFHNKKKTGELFWESASISAVRDAHGSITHFIAIKEDITERKALEAQAMRSQRLDTLGALAGGIAHDLNNVLAPILLSMEVLKKRETDAKTLTLLNAAEQSAQRGKAIISQILNFARGSEQKYGTIQMKHIIKELKEFMTETFPRNLTIHTDVAADLWPIKGDPTQLHQAIMNLAVNAKDAMPEGGVLTITTKNVQVGEDITRRYIDVQPGGYLQLTVSDTGVGMPPDVVERIFDPFFTTKATGEGTGLGLSTVQLVVSQHHGFVDVESNVGRGSTFRVFLPATHPSRKEAMEREIEEVFAGNGETILIIDDEASVREILKNALESIGYKVLTADDGPEGIAIFAHDQRDIALVITDLMMPHMDGLTVLRAIHHINRNAAVIVVSGLLSENRQREVLQAGARHFLQKPFSAREVFKAIDDVLRGKK